MAKRDKKLKKLRGEKRFRAPRIWRFWKPALLTMAVVALCLACLAAALVMFTGVTDVTHVNFSGQKYVGLDYLRQASGIGEQQNLVTLPVGRIAKSLMRNPWIKKVEVQRRLPHTVNITISERVPVAMIEVAGDGYLVDGTGMVMAGCPVDQLKEISRIHGGKNPPVIGEIVSNARVMECVKILDGMPVAMRRLLALGNPYDGRGPVFICTLGFNVVYGSSKDAARKNEVMEAILTDVKNNRRRIAYVDLRVPDSPVIRPL